MQIENPLASFAMTCCARTRHGLCDNKLCKGFLRNDMQYKGSARVLCVYMQCKGFLRDDMQYKGFLCDDILQGKKGLLECRIWNVTLRARFVVQPPHSNAISACHSCFLCMISTCTSVHALSSHNHDRQSQKTHVHRNDGCAAGYNKTSGKYWICYPSLCKKLDPGINVLP